MVGFHDFGGSVLNQTTQDCDGLEKEQGRTDTSVRVSDQLIIDAVAKLLVKAHTQSCVLVWISFLGI